MPDMILPDWLTRCYENVPDHLAVHYGDVFVTFAELERRVARLARQLATIGVKEGSCVALLAANSPEYIICVYALTRLRAVLVPLNTRLTREELCWQLCDVNAMLLIHDARYAATAMTLEGTPSGLRHAILAAEAIDDEIALYTLPEAQVALYSEIDLTITQAILYTSGTTGQPKGVMITYGMQWWNAIGSVLNMGHQRNDCWLVCLPLFHIGGLSILMRSVIYGISIVVLEKFDPYAVNKILLEENVTIISVVAVMLQRMLTALAEKTAARYPASLRCVLLGGGPAPRPLLEMCARKHIPVLQTYGLTESCSQAVTLAPEDALRKLGSAGKPLVPVQLCIMQDQQPSLAGEAGVICLKGPTITPGYIHTHTTTEQTFRDGWFSTGDIGYLDEEGYLYVLDRRSDMIVSGGENVYPAEIEAVLQAHPDVTEVGVCGRADAEWGQVPIAFVILQKGSTVQEQDLLAYAAQYLARYKLPRALYFVAQLPRNSTGKLLRRELYNLLPAQKR